jgi:hypothetical protein
MPHVGNISNIPNFIAVMHKIPIDDIKRDACAGMPYMRITIYGRPANIEPDIGRIDWFKCLFFLAKGIVDPDRKIVLVLHVSDQLKNYISTFERM